MAAGLLAKHAERFAAAVPVCGIWPPEDAPKMNGVAIWAFQPTMLHAKVMTVDGIISNVGSANLNARSTALDEEVNVVAIDPALTATLDRHFDDDLARSERVEAGRWQQRSLYERVFEAATRPFRGAF